MFKNIVQTTCNLVVQQGNWFSVELSRPQHVGLLADWCQPIYISGNRYVKQLLMSHTATSKRFFKTGTVACIESE